jgi:LysR family glycine cleavage system transcriptional activator
VGQQIRALEDMLGVMLFRRTPKGLELTPEGTAGLPALRDGFLMFEESVRAMQAGQSSFSLAIAAPRDLTSKWLAPRLAAYRRANPELRYRIFASEAGVDFAEANLDLAIRLADGPGGEEGVALVPGGFVTVVAPTVTDPAGAPLIGWPGCPGDQPEPAMRVEDAGLALDSAIAGLGRAAVPRLLAQDALAAGLVREAPAACPADARTYWLVAPVPQWRQKKVKALVAALLA